MPFNPSETTWSRLWLMTDEESEVLLKRLILQKIDTITKETGGFMASLSRISPRPNDVKPRWIQEIDYPRTIIGSFVQATGVLTVTGSLFGAAPTREALRKLVRLNSRLTFIDTATGTEYPCYVTAIDAADPKVTLAAVNSGTLPGDGTDMTWYLVSSPYTDSQDMDDNRWLQYQTEFAPTEIFADGIEVEKTRLMMRDILGGDVIEHQIDLLTKRMQRDIAMALINQTPVVSGNAVQTMYETPRPALAGVFWWLRSMFGTGGKWENPNQWVNGAGNPVTDDTINSLCAALTDAGANLKSGRWELWTTPAIGRMLCDIGESERILPADETKVGYMVESIQTKEGIVLPIRREPYFLPGRILIADMNALQWDYVQGDEISRKELPAGSSRYRRWMLDCQVCGLVVRRGPQAMAGGYNFAES